MRRSACHIRNLGRWSVREIKSYKKSQTHDYEDNGKHSEAQELDRLATPGIDEEEGNPVSWNEASDGEDQVTNANVVQVVVDTLGTLGDRRTEANCSKDDARVQSKAVESNLAYMIS